MKNTIKKSLIYQWFYTTKWVLLLTTVMWSLFSYIFIFDAKVEQFKHNIAQFTSNKISVIQPLGIVIFVGLLIFVYIFGNGIKKRSKIISINSGPYTRDQIFWNTVLCNIFVLILFIIIYIYLGICFKFKYNGLLNYDPNYFSVLFLDGLKLFSLGLITISYTLFMEKLFSNSIVTIITIALVPISSFFFFSINLRVISEVIPLDQIHYFKNMILTYLNWYQYIEADYLYTLTYNWSFNLICTFIIIIISIIILFIIKKLNRIVRIENISNFFIFKKSKYIISIFLSMLIVSWSSFAFNGILFMNNGFYRLKSVFIFVIMELLIISILSFIMNKLIDKFIK